MKIYQKYSTLNTLMIIANWIDTVVRIICAVWSRISLCRPAQTFDVLTFRKCNNRKNFVALQSIYYRHELCRNLLRTCGFLTLSGYNFFIIF